MAVVADIGAPGNVSFNSSTNYSSPEPSPEGCPEEEVYYYASILGTYLAVSDPEAVLRMLVFGVIIISTIVGNILVILSVFTHKPLRIVQNFFIVSLAVADLTVAILVLPLNVVSGLIGHKRWLFGKLVCKMWLTSDVMCCTASILNLCAIALDRYWAITDPIAYAQKRTMRRVMVMIIGVWVLSALISSPPLLGWNNWPEEFDINTPCLLTSEKGYVIYSSLGSFYVPLLIMTIVYIKIFIATRRRLRERAKASRLNAAKNCTVAKERQSPIDQESVSSEANHNENPTKSEKKKKGKKKKKKCNEEKSKFLTPNYAAEDSVTEAQDENIRLDGTCGTPPKNTITTSTTTTTTTTTTTSTTTTTATVDTLKSRSASQRDKVQVIVIPEVKRNTVHQFIEEKQKISLSKERRAARTLGIIMGVFVICWLPFFLMYVVGAYCECCFSDFLISLITWLGYLNSSLNPIIYTIFNLDFRKAFKKLLRMKT